MRNTVVHLACCLLLAYGVFSTGAQGAEHFGFDDVAQRARDLARTPWVSRPKVLPAALVSLGYDRWRDIRYRPERAIWRAEGLPFELMFFHPGNGNNQAVPISEIVREGAGQGVRPIVFDATAFDYGKNRLTLPPGSIPGFAGFRVHTSLNVAPAADAGKGADSRPYKDELISFLGASYFRALGANQQYGLSARGLAIDTTGGAGEEFPDFVEFWIERPAMGADALVIYALLDGPRATGAYQMTVRPGSATVTDVRARITLRDTTRPVVTLGMAPLTSMFRHGENQPRADDFRPEVHDSDGLMMANGDGEWLWRPLINPRYPLATSFALRDPKGFGLMQRDRSFTSYEDVEARYERRPSAWVTPLGQWGAGRVELLQLPTPDETHDNIVAYWVPAVLPPPGRDLDLAWRIAWEGDRLTRPPHGWTVQSRRGRGLSALRRDEIQYIVDFTGPALEDLPDNADVLAVVSAGANARVMAQQVYRNPVRNVWRMALRVRLADVTQPTELRAFLKHANHTLSETWTTLIQPE